MSRAADVSGFVLLYEFLPDSVDVNHLQATTLEGNISRVLAELLVGFDVERSIAICRLHHQLLQQLLLAHRLACVASYE